MKLSHKISILESENICRNQTLRPNAPNSNPTPCTYDNPVTHRSNPKNVLCLSAIEKILSKPIEQNSLYTEAITPAHVTIFYSDWNEFTNIKFTKKVSPEKYGSGVYCSTTT